MDLGDRQRPLLTLTGHPRADLLLERDELLPRRTMAVQTGRTHRFGDRPDQPVIDGAHVVTAA